MVRAAILLALSLAAGSPATEPASVAELERCRDPAEAVRIARRIERSFPVRKPRWRELYRTARALERLKLVDLACRMVRDHWELCGGEFEYNARALIAQILLESGRFEAALPEAEQALYLAQVWEGRSGWDGAPQAAHLRLAKIHQGREDWRKAIEHYRTSNTIGHELDVAKCLHRAGEGREARVFLRKALVNPRMSFCRRALRLYVLTAHEDGTLPEAMRALETLDKKARNRLRTPLTLANAFAKGDPGAVVEAFGRRPSREGWFERDLQAAAAYLTLLDRERTLAELRRRISGGDLFAVDIVAHTSLEELVPALEKRAARERDADRIRRIRRTVERLRSTE
jgi:tetratricopeptide (TPR) repeat protein